MMTDVVPTPSERRVQEKQDRIAHANDKGCGKNSAQDDGNVCLGKPSPLRSGVLLWTRRGSLLSGLWDLSL